MLRLAARPSTSLRAGTEGAPLIRNRSYSQDLELGPPI